MLVPTIGASYTNNSGSIITQLTISYYGEQWRLGATGRSDKLTFSYSLDATSLSTGSWTTVTSLDFTAPNSTGTIGALDGNSSSNRSLVSYTITGLSIASGATFWIRFSDVNITGADDALGIDDWSLTPAGASGTPALAISGTPTNHGSICPNSSGSAVQYTITNSGTVQADGVTVTSNDTQFAVSGLSSTSIAASGGTATFNVTFTPLSAGAKSATITAHSTTSGSTDGTINLTGTGATPVTPSVSINDPGTICNNQSVTFTPVPANLGGGTASYSWTINGVPGTETGNTYTQSTWTQGNSVQVVMTVTGGCVTSTTASSNTVTPTVISPETPSVNIAITSGNNPSCAGSSVTFTATASNLGGGSVSLYQWKVDGSGVGTNNSTYSTTSLADGQLVTCEITVSGGCVTASTAASSAITMSIIALPATPIASNNGPLCAGATLNLTSDATGTIVWSGPNSFSSGDQNPTIIPVTVDAAGTYSVTSTVGGCTSPTGTTIVTINTAPSITSHPASASIYVGGSNTFSVTATGAGLNYQWQLNGSDISGANASTYTVSGATLAMSGDSYTCVVSGTCSPSATSNAAILTVSDLPCGGTESFTLSNLTASYASGSFAGDVTTWTYVDSRDESTYGITGKGCMFRGLLTAKLTSGSVSGIGSFTCKLKKGFTGVGLRQVGLYVNGVFKGASIAWDNTTTQTFTVNNINVAGSVIIEIRNLAPYQVVIDDISWTCYAPPATPTASAATDINCNGFTANWNSITGATGYLLDVSPVVPFTFDVTSISEDFVNCPNQTSTNIAGSLNTYLQTPGWTGAQIYPYGGYIRLGSNSNQGILTTPTIDLSGGTALLSFDLWYYDAGAGIEILHAPDGVTFTSITTIVAPPSSVPQFVAITGGTANSKIRIQGLVAANCRFYLDNFLVVKTISNCLAGYNNLSVSGTSQVVSGLAPNTTYYYQVYSVGANGISPSSNIITASTNSINIWQGTISNDWNVAGNWACGIPTATTDVIIPNVSPNFMPVVTSSGTSLCKDITINSGVSLTVSSGSDLAVYGNWTNNGTSALGDGTIIFAGSSAQAINGTNTFGNLNINNGSGVSLNNPSGVAGVLTLTQGVLNSGGNLTLLSNTTATALVAGTGSGSISGNVTMQRYMPNKLGYHYYSSPFSAAPITEFTDEIGSIITGDPYVNNDITQTVTPFPNFYLYQESKPFPVIEIGWDAASSPMEIMRGYCINFGGATGPITTDVAGTVNTGPYSIGLTNTSSGNPVSDGWNLVGNPYPSPIDWDAAGGWAKTNVDDGVYYFKANSHYYGTYSSYVGGYSTNGGTNIIPSMQGFFVKANASTGSLGVNNAARLNAQPTFFKSTNTSNPLLRLRGYPTQNSAHSDETIIYFDQNATAMFDGAYDAYKLMNNDPAFPNIFTKDSSVYTLSINALPPLSAADVVIPLGFSTKTNGSFTINASEILNFDPSQHVYLEDNQTSTIQDLTLNPVYTFTTTANAPQYRFFIRFSPTIVTGIDENNTSFVDAWSSGKDIYVNYSNTTLQKAVISVYDMLGQQVISDEVQGSSTFRYTVGKPGCYIINVIGGGNSFQKKIIIL